MLTTPGRQVGLAAQIGEEEGGQRRGAGRLEDDRVAGGERRGDLPGQHQQREVPGDDLGGDAERPRDPAREGVVELVRPAGVVPEVGRRERHVDVARLLDRLARVDRFEDGELARALLEQAGDPEQVLRPLAAGQLAPRLRLGLARGPDRRVDVGLGRPGDLGQGLLGRRVDRGEGRPVGGRDVLAADEQPVALVDRDDLARLGRRRVFPGDRLAVAEAPAVRRPPVTLSSPDRAPVSSRWPSGHYAFASSRRRAVPLRRAHAAGSSSASSAGARRGSGANGPDWNIPDAASRSACRSAESVDVPPGATSSQCQGSAVGAAPRRCPATSEAPRRRSSVYDRAIEYASGERQRAESVVRPQTRRT